MSAAREEVGAGQQTATWSNRSKTNSGWRWALGCHSALAAAACCDDVGVPVERCAGYAECLGDVGGAFAAGETGGGGSEFVGVHDAGSAADAALGAGRRRARREEAAMRCQGRCFCYQ